MRRLWAKFLNLILPSRAEREMEREMRAHLALITDKFIRQGMSNEDAELAARRAYGGFDQARELHRQERSFPWVEQSWKDLRFAVRGLARNPGFTALAAITLALGIGVNATLFATYNAVALKPLPVADPSRVVRLQRQLESGSHGDINYGFAYPEYQYLRDHASAFAGMVAASFPVPALAAIPGSIARQRARGELVSTNYFADLGISPVLGRTFLQRNAAEEAGQDRVVVLGYGFWKRALFGEPGALGRVIQLNGVALTIIGVAPESFTGANVYPQEPDFWAPLSLTAEISPGQDLAWHDRGARWFQIVGRLRPSVSLNSARAETELLLRQFLTGYTEWDPTKSVTVKRTAYFGDADDPRFQAFVAAMMLVFGLVLLVACANVANMLLSRGAARQREIGIRLALGGSRMRVVRLLLTESLLLSLLGGAMGLTIAMSISKVLYLGVLSVFSPFLPGVNFSDLNTSLDLRVFLYALALSAATGLLFGVAPALRFSGLGLTAALKDENSAFRFSRSRLRSCLVGAQSAVSMLLLITAGLLTRGLLRSQAADPGFDTRNLYLVFGSRDRGLVDRLKALPSIQSVALGSAPLTGTWTTEVRVGNATSATIASLASENYFHTLGISLRRGRDFTRQEAERGGSVAIVSESAARRFFPGEEPLGKRFTIFIPGRNRLEKAKAEDFEVIGVTKDVRYSNLTRVDPAHIFFPIASLSATGENIMIRIQGNRQRALAAVQTEVERFSSAILPNLDVVSLDEGPLRAHKALAKVAGIAAAILAFLALALAGVGVYGVIGYLVNLRVKEIGIRVALGAKSRAVLASVVVRGLFPVFAGMVVGLAVATALSTLLHQTLVFPGSIDFLYGVPFYDPITFLGAVAFVTVIAFLASAAPARRALRVDPVIALRYE
jgi:predicted permease